MNMGLDKENDFIVKERSYRLAKAINNRIHPHNFFATHSNWYRVTTRPFTTAALPLDDGSYLYYNPKTGEVSTILPDGYPFSDEDLLFSNVLDGEDPHMEEACTAHVLSLRLRTAVMASLFNRSLPECMGATSSAGRKTEASTGLSSASWSTAYRHPSSIDARADTSSLMRDARADGLARDVRPKENSVSSRESRAKEASISSRESRAKEASISSRESRAKEASISSRESRAKEASISSRESRTKHASSADAAGRRNTMQSGGRLGLSAAAFTSAVVPTANQQGEGFGALFPHLTELRGLLFESGCVVEW